MPAQSIENMPRDLRNGVGACVSVIAEDAGVQSNLGSI